MDLVIIGLDFALVFVIGFCFSKKERTSLFPCPPEHRLVRDRCVPLRFEGLAILILLLLVLKTVPAST